MNRTLAKAALDAIHDPNIESDKGWCQRFIRQIVTKSLGAKWGALVQTPSARQSAYKLIDAGFAKHYNGQPLEAGDILYKTVGSGGFGHVGIWTGDSVAENSSWQAAHHGNGNAKGTRTLEQFGDFQVVARLPEPNTIAATGNVSGQEKPVRYFLETPLGETELKGAELKGSRLVANVADVAQACGFKLTVRNDQTDTDGKYYIRAESK